jgi:uncharacterized membrane protein
MPKLIYAEHPVHSVVNDFPAALVPASVVFDMLHLVTRRGSFKVAAFFSLLMALVTGGAAAATGLQDYQDIPEGTEAKRVANAHALLNVGMLAAVAVQLLIRFTGKVGLFARLLNVATAAGLAAGGWYGSRLVYRHGVRVREPEPMTLTADAGADRGKALAVRLESLLDRVPDTDLTRSFTQAASIDDHGWPDDGRFDDQGALSGAVPDGRSVDVSAAVRESLPGEQVLR